MCLASATAAAQVTSPRRRLPDYDGRPDAGTRPIEVVAWVPRIVLSPLWLVSEFVVRRPLGWLVVRAERGNWPTALVSFFTFGEEKKVGVVPTFFVDLGFRPKVGLYVFWDEAGHEAHSLRLRGTAWSDGFTASFADRWRTDERGSRLTFAAQASLRPDRLFWGLGPRSPEEDKARFAELRLVGSAAFALRLGRFDVLELEAGVRSVDFRDHTCCSGPSLAELIAAGEVGSPPGFADGGYQTFYQRLSGALDSRSPRPDDQTGARLAVELEHGYGFDEQGWLRGGATAGAYWDVGGTGRVLGLVVTTAFAGATRGEVPFTELVELGGQEVMQGLRSARLRGESALALSLRYEWPIWVNLGGSLQVDAGNVFGEWLDGLDPELARLSFAFGVRTLGTGDHGLQLLVGFGTETFLDGADLTSLRLAIGGTYGF